MGEFVFLFLKLSEMEKKKKRFASVICFFFFRKKNKDFLKQRKSCREEDSQAKKFSDHSKLGF